VNLAADRELYCLSAVFCFQKGSDDMEMKMGNRRSREVRISESYGNRAALYLVFRNGKIRQFGNFFEVLLLKLRELFLVLCPNNEEMVLGVLVGPAIFRKKPKFSFLENGVFVVKEVFGAKRALSLLMNFFDYLFVFSLPRVLDADNRFSHPFFTSCASRASRCFFTVCSIMPVDEVFSAWRGRTTTCSANCLMSSICSGG